MKLVPRTFEVWRAVPRTWQPIAWEAIQVDDVFRIQSPDPDGRAYRCTARLPDDALQVQAADRPDNTALTMP